MSTQIQFLRTDQAQLRPDPNVLANGMPLLNFNEQEPGLFFKARDGSLFKVGPTSVGELAPNSGANGYPGNTLGEMWLDTSGQVDQLKVYNGVDWVIPGAGSTQVSSVGLQMPTTIFDVENSPITSAGTFEVNLQPQVRNRVLAGPIEGSAQIPTFRALGSDDIPGLDATKVVSGLLNQARIPSLDASKITSGVFNSARIPGIDATKIISGVLPYQFGGTGVGTTPSNGQLLIGSTQGWNKANLTAGPGIGVINGAGTLTVKVSPPGAGGEVMFNNGGVLGADNNFTYNGAANILTLLGTMELTGDLQLKTSASPSTISFKPMTGGDVTLSAPNLVTGGGYSLRLPQTIPASNTDRVMVSDGSGNLELTDSVDVENLSVRTALTLKDSIGSAYDITVRASSSTTASYTLTLPPSVSTGGAVTSDTSGNLSVSQAVSLTSLNATSLSASTTTLNATNPPRQLVSGYASLTVTSNGTYDLLDIDTGGSPAFISLTVFAHDESASVGTGTYCGTFSMTYNGTAATISSVSNEVDTWSTNQPTFAAAYSGTDLLFRATTTSGSNTLRFMVKYSYGVNIAP